MFRLTHVSRAIVAIGATSVAAAVLAQQAPANTNLQRVEVTGSNIKRTDTETAAPVTVITREEMQRSGATTLADVVNKLTVSQGGLSGVEFSGFTPGAATVALRGLGAGATLVLVNGRRIAPYGITGFQETFSSINSIPISAVERIDILKDGASAIYGSEAIAGVVNIILRNDYNGAEVGAQYRQSQGGVLQVGRLNFGYGFGDLASDKFQAFINYEHTEQEDAKVSENRFYPSRDLRAFLNDPSQDFRSSYSVPGNIVRGTAISALPGCEPRNIRNVGGVDRCLLDVFDYNTMVPKVSRDSLYGRGVLQINAETQAFLEVGVSRSSQKYAFDPQFYYNTASQRARAPGAPYGVAGTAEYIFRTGDLGPRTIDVKSDEHRVILGLKGAVGRWDYDTAIGMLGGKVDLKRGGQILTSAMEAALASGQYVPGAVNPQAVRDRISPAGVFDRNGKADTTFVDFKTTAELFTLPAGPVGFAAGLEWRREKQKDNFANAYLTGDVFGFGTLRPLNSTRTAQSGFVEFGIPILRSLEAQLAARHDRYSVGGRSTTPKAGIKWTALPNLVLRSTYAEGFRVANPRETSTDVSVGFFNGVQDPVRCPTVVSTNPDCSLSIQANVSGNQNLEPEKSRSFTAGLVYEPVKDTSFTVDLWRIKRRNEIASLSSTYLLANQSLFPQYIRRDATGRITNLDLPYVNLAGTAVRGVDVEMKSKVNIGEWGKLNFGAQGTHYDYFKVQPVPNAPVENYNGTYVQPRWRANARVGWEYRSFVTELSYNHVGKYLNKPTPSGVCSAPANLAQYCTIGSWDTFGLYLGYKGIKDLDLGLSIDNITDKAPPFDYRSGVNSQTYAWSPLYHNAFGRIITLRANYKFK